jgi:hypothetical protein
MSIELMLTLHSIDVSRQLATTVIEGHNLSHFLVAPCGQLCCACSCSHHCTVENPTRFHMLLGRRDASAVLKHASSQNCVDRQHLMCRMQKKRNLGGWSAKSAWRLERSFLDHCFMRSAQSAMSIVHECLQAASRIEKM